MASTERQALIERIRDLPGELTLVVSDLSDDELLTPYVPGEWTVAQNVHHVADAHVTLYFRIKLCLGKEQPTINTAPINAWANLPDGDVKSLDASLAIISGLHHRLTVLLSNLPDADFGRTFQHPERGTLILDDLVRSISQHGYAHIEQIKQTLAAKPTL